VRDVDHHPQPIHLEHHSATKGSETAVLRFQHLTRSRRICPAGMEGMRESIVGVIWRYHFFVPLAEVNREILSLRYRGSPQIVHFHTWRF
jgi:hypothetical protein